MLNTPLTSLGSEQQRRPPRRGTVRQASDGGESSGAESDSSDEDLLEGSVRSAVAAGRERDREGEPEGDDSTV